LKAQPTAAQSAAQLLDRAQVARTLQRLAHEIVERHTTQPRLVLAGVPTRGVPLASRLAALAATLGCRAAVVELDPRGYRDDRPRPAQTGSSPLRSVDGDAVPAMTGAVVIVVDDVLYTGRTLRAAVDALMSAGRPAAVEVLVLVDRGHREVPLRATYVGKNIPTAARDRVAVKLAEVDGVDGAWLVEGASG